MKYQKQIDVDRDFCREFCNAWHGDRKKGGEGRCMIGICSGIPKEEWLCGWNDEIIKKKLGGIK